MADSDKNDTYMLNRDFTASTRLNCQHYMWQQELQFTLHCTVPKPGSGARIADVATGTGVWLLEVARQYPEVNCLGLDISTAQCPPKSWLPSNIDFKPWSFLEEAPEELRGVFDIVHIRLIGIVIEHDPIPAIKNIAMLLKPDGFLQWEEMDLSRTVIATADESIKADAVTRMDALMKTHGARVWVSNLAATLNANGFHNVKEYDVEPDLALLKFHTDMHVLAWAEIASGQPEGSERKERFSRMITEVREETKMGVGHGATKVIFVAQRDG